MTLFAAVNESAVVWDFERRCACDITIYVYAYVYAGLKCGWNTPCLIDPRWLEHGGCLPGSVSLPTPVNESTGWEPIRSASLATATMGGCMPSWSKEIDGFLKVSRHLLMRSSHCLTRCSPMREPTHCMTITSFIISMPRGTRR